MKYKETCQHCHHTKNAFVHKINRPIVNGLKQLVEFYKNNKKGCNINQDLQLSHNQKCNLPKLQHFGLMVRLDDGWYPTQRGYEFIHGMRKTMIRVVTFDGIVPLKDHPAWNDVKIEFRDVWEIDDTAYLKREDYINQNTLFTI